MAFAETLNKALWLKKNLYNILEIHICLELMTDSLRLFDALIDATRTIEKKLKINFENVKDGYKSFEVNDVALQKSEHNGTDALIMMETDSIWSTFLKHAN